MAEFFYKILFALANINNPTSKSGSSRIIRLCVGAFGICLGITILFFIMRSVLAVGGFCAEGGPYQIAVHCPKGVTLLAPIAIFSMIISFFLYFFSIIEGGPNFALFFWSGLFLSLGWNFFESAFNPPNKSGIVMSWLVCGIVFAILGIAPLLLFGKKNLISFLLGSNQEPLIENRTAFPMSRQRVLLVVLQLIAVSLGITAGILIFYTVAY